jgi:hypothetical protein
MKPSSLHLHQELFGFIRWALHHAMPFGWGVPEIKGPQSPASGGTLFGGQPNPTQPNPQALPPLH